MVAAKLSIYPVIARRLDPTLRRAPKQDSMAFVRPDGLEYCLACWKDWMSGDPDRDMGTVTMRGLTGDDSRNIDTGEAQQDNDNRIGAATDAAISDLSTIHTWAIKRSCSIASVWRFPNADFIEVAAEAKDELTKKLKRNICTSVLF